MDLTSLKTPQKADLLISFMDIQNFIGIGRELTDPLKLFDLLNAMARAVIEEVEGTSGLVVKFIGDSCLTVFPEEDADAAIRVILAVKQKVEKLLSGMGFPNKLRVTAHCGEAAIGPYGYGGNIRLDVFGESVNTAAMLGRGEHRGKLILSPQAFRKLSPEARKMFHKHTPPIVYVAED
jgi:class 3 adenylate cyclase